MHFLARTLAFLFAALLMIIIGTLLWLQFSQTEPQVTQTTTRSFHTDSAKSTNPAPESRSSQRDSPISTSVQSPLPLGPNPPLRTTTGLVIPVIGVTPDELVDTYTQSRWGGRSHDAIDIVAPHNCPVVAAQAGRVVRLFQSIRGGTTIYELGPHEDTVYYYAHLDHYVAGLAEGMNVERGQLLGYVGDTGDAGAGNYHLHFAIWLIQDPKHYWDGTNINPYPMLRLVK